MLTTTVAAGILSGLLGAAGPAVMTSALAAQAPWSDPNAAGTITLCDQQGHAITSGSVDDKPWVWKAVASQGAAGPYSSGKAWAQVFLYAPIKGSAPSTWAGEAMAGSSQYSDLAHPTAMSTSLDLPLSVFLGDYRLGWNGYAQARMVLSSEGVGFDPNYPALTIQVIGKTWRVVGPTGTAPCDAGQARSDEISALELPASGVAPSSRTAVNPTNTVTAQPGKIGNADDPNPSGSAATGAAPARVTPADVAAAATLTEPGSAYPWWPALLLLTGLGLAGGAVVVARRTAPASSGAKHQSGRHD